MFGKPTNFWGKITKDQTDSVIAWHPLLDHCADVAACTQALLNQAIIRKRIAACGGMEDFNETQQARLCVLAALHDVGKFNIGFQNKALANPSFVDGHVSQTVWLFGSESQIRTEFLKALRLFEIMHWASEDALPRLLLAAICHHGRPISCQGGNANTALWKPNTILNPFDGISNLAEKVKPWFPKAFSSNEELPFPAKPELQHAFSGLVMLADWLASDEHFFPFSNDANADRFSFSQKNAQLVCENIFLNPIRAVEALGQQLVGFENIFGFSPRGVQISTEDIKMPETGSVIIIEAETGSGKTEAAFRYFLRLFHARKVDGMYFALPTRTAATQIHSRITKYVKNAFREKAPPVTLAVPGYLQTDEVKGERLAPFDVLWNDNDKERFRYRGWAAEHPKRYLAGSIVIGTIDQVLLSALTVSHAHMRATALFRHLLVVDEVHASDPYMRRILSEVIQRHTGAGGHALLMSATIGCEMRQKLLNLSESISLEEAVRFPYPLISDNSYNVNKLKIRYSCKQKTVSVDLKPLMNDEAGIAKIGLNAAKAGAKTVILRNTVNGAIAVQKLIERLAVNENNLLFTCNNVSALHHSRFSKEDRETLDKALEEIYGKTRHSGGRVVVATQTIQQSLDLDADLMITDLCPIDVLLQRIGRLHRHDRNPEERPDDFRSAKVIVLIPNDRDLTKFIHSNGHARGPHGIGTVYPDLRILESTWRLLEGNKQFDIPSMNRKLVENALHEEIIKKVVDSDIWQKHSNVIEGILHAQRQNAILNLVEWDKEFGEYSFGDVSQKVKSRLGECDRLADFEREIKSPFGKTFHCLTIPSHWSHGIEEDEKPRILKEDGAGIVFEIGERKFIYDHWGLRLCEEDTTLETDD
jgi:CRISPR-associated helicase Cas3/CRISPR-associated endonuclease Cas3-HD